MGVLVSGTKGILQTLSLNAQVWHLTQWMKRRTKTSIPPIDETSRYGASG